MFVKKPLIHRFTRYIVFSSVIDIYEDPAHGAVRGYLTGVLQLFRLHLGLSQLTAATATKQPSTLPSSSSSLPQV